MGTSGHLIERGYEGYACVEIYHHTLLFQTQWLGKRQNGSIERLSKETAVEGRGGGGRPTAKPQRGKWMK
jgi:hypothetical protein